MLNTNSLILYFFCLLYFLLINNHHLLNFRKSVKRSCGFAIRRQKRLDLFDADLQSASSEIS